MKNYDNTEPLITVVLSVYNGGKYLVESVESVLRQSLDQFEFIINDDCSTDNSWKYLQSLKDQRIKLMRQSENCGLFANLNQMISISRSPLIKLWSQDDIMYGDCLSKIVEFHKTYPGIGFSYTGRDLIDEYGTLKPNNDIDNTPEIISTELHTKIAYYIGSIAGNIANVSINKSALKKVGLFNETMKISADFDMWVRIAEFYETGHIRQNLIQLRDHSGQLSRKQEYYLNHVIEDLVVYKKLLAYSPPSLKKQGTYMLRKYKFVYYYTLMVKSFLTGNFATALKYYKQLTKFSSFPNLTFSFIKWKILKPGKPTLLTNETFGVNAEDKTRSVH